MQRFAAKQLDESGEPLYYLVEYEVDESAGVFAYTGRAYATNDVNRELSENDEAFSFSFHRAGIDWSRIDKIEVWSRLGEDMALRIRNTFFGDLVLSGIMGLEQRKN